MKTKPLDPSELVGQMMHEVVQARLQKELNEINQRILPLLEPLQLGAYISNTLTQIDVERNGEKLQRLECKTAISASDMMRYIERCIVERRLPEIEREVQKEIMRRLELIPKE